MKKVVKAKKGVMEREERLHEVDRLSRLGYSQREIAEITGVSQPCIALDMKEVKKRYMETEQDERKIWLWRETKVILDIRKEAWEAWQTSKENAQKYSKETKTSPAYKMTNKQGENVTIGGGKTITEKEEENGRLPDPGYLNIMMDTNKRLAALWGLDEAAKIELKALIGVSLVNWDRLWSMSDSENRTRELPSEVRETDPIRLAIELAVKTAVEQQKANQLANEEVIKEGKEVVNGKHKKASEANGHR